MPDLVIAEIVVWGAGATFVVLMLYFVAVMVWRK